MTIIQTYQALSRLLERAEETSEIDLCEKVAYKLLLDEGAEGEFERIISQATSRRIALATVKSMGVPFDA